MKNFSLVFTLFIFLSVNSYAQTLYVPSGTAGIGSSSTANVGIGISNPAEKLTINGNIRGNASGGALRISTGNGYIDIGPQNTSGAHIYTDRSYFFFNKPVSLLTGELCSYNTTDLILKTNTTSRLIIKNTNGYIGIGTTNPSALLTVNGGIKAEKVEVIADVPASDFVFNTDYKLMTLSELDRFVKANKHLPEIPSAEEFKANGYSVGQMDDLLLRKVEEITLYLISQDERIASLEAENAQLKSQIDQLNK